MDQATAATRLRSMVSWQDDPALTAGELEQLLDLAKRPDRAGNLPTNLSTSASTWTAATMYQAGTVIKTGTTLLRYWMVLIPGLSGTATPSWPDLAGIPKSDTLVADNSVTWRDVGMEWAPTWDLNAAAAEGWRWKAAKVAGRHDFATDGQTFAAGDLQAHCLEQAAVFGGRAPGSTSTTAARATGPVSRWA